VTGAGQNGEARGNGRGGVGDERLRRIAWGVLALAVAASVAGASPPTLWARLFFGVLFLSGAVALAALAGAKAQVLTAVAILLLVLVQRTVERPVLEPPSPQWTRPLLQPGHLVRHEMRLPVGSSGWDEAWGRARGAYVFVCARSPLSAADGLALEVNGESLGPITESLASGPRPGPTFVGFYRVPVQRAVLERQRPAVFVVQRLPGATPRPVDLCGTFTLRPTAGLDSSRLFDGVAWWHPGPAQGGRFVVELRLEDSSGTPFKIWY